jgi:hypothetical protein
MSRGRLNDLDESMIENLAKATDKYGAAMAMQPEAVRRLVPDEGSVKARSSAEKKASEVNVRPSRRRVMFHAVE